MAIRTTDPDRVALYEDTGDMPLATPVFESEEAAEDFVTWYGNRYPSAVSVAKLDIRTLSDVRDEWENKVRDEDSGEIDPAYFEAAS